MNSDITFLLLQ